MAIALVCALQSAAADVVLRVMSDDFSLISTPQGDRSLRIAVETPLALGDVQVKVQLRRFNQSGQVDNAVAATAETSEEINGGGGEVKVVFPKMEIGFYELIMLASGTEGDLARARTTYAVVPVGANRMGISLKNLCASGESNERKKVDGVEDAGRIVQGFLEGRLKEKASTFNCAFQDEAESAVGILRADFSPKPAYVAAAVALWTVDGQKEGWISPSSSDGKVIQYGKEGHGVTVFWSNGSKEVDLELTLPAGRYWVRDWQGRDSVLIVTDKPVRVKAGILPHYIIPQLS